jgi:hypothetical protein
LPFAALYRLQVSARRHLVAAVLFGVHPLLALTPTDDFLDAPGDHPLVKNRTPDDNAPAIGWKWLSDDLWTCVSVDYTAKCLSALRQIRVIEEVEAPPLDHRKSWDVVWQDECGRIVGGPAGPHSESEMRAMQFYFLVADTSKNEEPGEYFQGLPTNTARAEKPTTCPFANAPTSASPPHCEIGDLKHGVMDNLELLVEARRLLESASELMAAGFLDEAASCCVAVRCMVPGSSLDARALELIAEATQSDSMSTPAHATTSEAAQLGPTKKYEDLPQLLQQVRDTWEQASCLLSDLWRQVGAFFGLPYLGLELLEDFPQI